MTHNPDDRGAIAWFAKNPVAANLLMLSIALLGIHAAFMRLPLEVFPSITSDRLSIVTAYPGATPLEVERSITNRLESAVRDLPQIDELTSSSREGSSQIQVTLQRGQNLARAERDLQQRLDSVNDLPTEAETPEIERFERRFEVISVVISGDLQERELRLLADRAQDELLQLDSVSQVDLVSVRPYELTIDVDPVRLRQYQLTLDQVASAIRAGSADLAAGNLRTLGGDILIRTRGQAESVREFAQIKLRTDALGNTLRLSDIAQVQDGFNETMIDNRFDGTPAIMLDIYRVGDQSALVVAQSIREYVDNQPAWLPTHVKMDYWLDRSRILSARLNTLLVNAAQGCLLVMVLLTLFLRPSIAFWVTIGIPVSFLGCLSVLPFFGVSINIISLFAFILVLGIVVDDAIVTGENIYTHARAGASSYRAAVDGTREIATPVTFGILTTIAAFAPLALLPGPRGAIFSQIPAVVIPVLLFSLLESKLVLPAHLAKYNYTQSKTGLMLHLERVQNAIADALEQALRWCYQPLLKLALRYRYATVAAFISVLAITLALTSSGRLKFLFFPKVESEIATVSLSMPIGTPFRVTQNAIDQIADAAIDIRTQQTQTLGQSSILHIFSTAGSSGGSGAGASHYGRVMIEMMAAEERQANMPGAKALVAQWRKLIGPIPGAESLTFRAETGRGRDPIRLDFSSKDFDQLQQVAQATKQHLLQYEGLFDISDNFSNGKRELEVQLKPRGALLGLNVSELAKQIRQAFYGQEIQSFTRTQDSVSVTLRYPESARSSISDLEQLPIRTASGVELPFAEVAQVQHSRGPAQIRHVDQHRVISVSADADKEQTDLNVVRRSIDTWLEQELLVNFPAVSAGFAGEGREQKQVFGGLISGAIGFALAVYILLAIPFRSYLQPFLVILVIPFGLIGAFLGHVLMGKSLSIMSIMGMLALSGVIVNDALVLVDYINQRRRSGFSLKEAVATAGVARFRAVLLTSITTFAGLAPLLLDQSTQAQFLIPMAISLGFGILFATFVTLLLVPCNYLIAADIKRLFTTPKS